MNPTARKTCWSSRTKLETRRAMLKSALGVLNERESASSRPAACATIRSRWRISPPSSTSAANAFEKVQDAARSRCAGISKAERFRGFLFQAASCLAGEISRISTALPFPAPSIPRQNPAREKLRRRHRSSLGVRLVRTRGDRPGGPAGPQNHADRTPPAAPQSRGATGSGHSRETPLRPSTPMGQAPALAGAKLRKLPARRYGPRKPELTASRRPRLRGPRPSVQDGRHDKCGTGREGVEKIARIFRAIPWGRLETMGEQSMSLRQA
jgi:hypothetical protein